jgi:hypothetical protein
MVGRTEIDGLETSESSFFNENSLPELSAPRNTKEQIKILFDYKKGIIKSPYFD